MPPAGNIRLRDIEGTALGEMTLAILWTNAVSGRIGRWRFRCRDREIAQ